MCSSVQPKMFAAAQPLGTGGTAAPPIVYPGGKPPNTDVGAPANTPSPQSFLGSGALNGINPTSQMVRAGTFSLNPASSGRFGTGPLGGGRIPYLGGPVGTSRFSF